MKSDLSTALLAATLLLASAASHATTVAVIESEQNDSFAGAQALATLAAGESGYRITGSRTLSAFLGLPVDRSADYFRFFVPGATLLSLDALVTASAPDSGRDPLLYLYDPQGNVFAYDDNSGVDFGARINALPIPFGGEYIVAVSGFGDAGDPDNGGNGILEGIGGDADFTYLLSIDLAPQAAPLPVPVPGSAALLLGGAALMAGFGRWRRNKPNA